MALRGPSKGASRDVVISSTVEIGAAAEVIWPYLVDWENLDRWMHEASDFRIIGEQREGVGVEAEATVRIAGITTHDRVRVSRWEPPWILEITHLGWVKGEGYMELSATDDGVTSVFWRERLVPPLGLLGAMAMRLFRPSMRRTFARDLRQLKHLAESDRGHGAV